MPIRGMSALWVQHTLPPQLVYQPFLFQFSSCSNCSSAVCTPHCTWSAWLHIMNVGTNWVNASLYSQSGGHCCSVHTTLHLNCLTDYHETTRQLHCISSTYTWYVKWYFKVGSAHHTALELLDWLSWNEETDSLHVFMQAFYIHLLNDTSKWDLHTTLHLNCLTDKLSWCFPLLSKWNPRQCAHHTALELLKCIKVMNFGTNWANASLYSQNGTHCSVHICFT